MPPSVDGHLDITGFKARTSLVAYKIKQWRHVDDYTVLPLVQLWKAFGSSGPDVCKDVEDSIFRIMARLPGDKYLKRSQKARWGSGSWQKRFPHVTLQHGLRTMEKHQGEYLK